MSDPQPDSISAIVVGLLIRRLSNLQPLTPLTDDRFPLLATYENQRHLVVVIRVSDDNYRPRMPTNLEKVEHFALQRKHDARSTIVVTLLGPPWQVDWGGLPGE